MTSCNTIIQILEELAPPRYAFSWDNVGLLLGRRRARAQRIAVAVALNDTVMQEVLEKRCDMLITYHPVLHKVVSRINDDDYLGRWILELLTHNVSCYAIHTNLDAAPDGFTDQILSKLKLDLEGPLLKSGARDRDGLESGRGRTALCKEPLSFEELSDRIEKEFGMKPTPWIRPHKKNVHRVGLVIGSGKEYIRLAEEAECDVLIAGGFSELSGKEALSAGISVLDVGPLGFEPFVVTYLCDALKKALPGGPIIIPILPET